MAVRVLGRDQTRDLGCSSNSLELFGTRSVFAFIFVGGLPISTVQSSQSSEASGRLDKVCTWLTMQRLQVAVKTKP